METKICSKCSKDLPITEYYTIRNKNSKDYTYTYCKKCHYSKMTKHTSKKWRKDNPKRWSEDVVKATKAMFERHREGVYLIVSTKGLYIGQTDKYEHRIYQHRNSNFKGNVKYKGAKVLFATLLVEEYDPVKRREIEKKYIQLLRPALNIAANPDWEKEKRIGGKYIRKS